MSGPGSESPVGPAPGGPPRPDRIAAGRAVILVVVAIVAGVFILQVASRPITVHVTKPSSTTSTTTTTTTTTHGHSSSTGSSATTPTPKVQVLVANGSGVTHAAGYFSTELKADGWSTLTPTTAPPAPTSVVYYAAGQQSAATKVATALGVPSSSIQPLPAGSIGVSGSTHASVVVIVGQDLGAKYQQIASATTTTSAATTTSSTTTSSTTSAATTSTATTAPPNANG